MVHTITSCNAQDALKAAYVELFQGLGVSAVCYPGFAAVEESNGATAASLILFWTSLSMVVLSERILPRHLNDGTTDSCSPETAKTGGMLELH